ncbi:beta-1,3-galactosyltransferase 2 [Trichomycterus rosablanca]|uniref:beta-1,3-galactosyltransferase 2 n=1 Tax=Trichomycterus rosablanca TaxID=2290929 RepID=UPI002F358C46
MAKFPKSRLLKCLALLLLLSLFCYIYVKSSANSIPKRFTSLPEDLYKPVSPLSYKYLLNQPNLCQRRIPFLVLMIPVRLQDRESRAAIRKTWGQENLVPNVDIVRVFFIGQPKENDPKHQEDLQKESKTHLDIVQMDFLDTYHNLTIKTMMMMNWLDTHCPTAQYAMKIDADIFLNVPYLVDYLQNQAYKQDYITGSVITDGTPRRNKYSKWYLSEELYPEDKFPPYLSGAGYVFSVDLASKIVQASRFVVPIPLEDVYIGLCLHFLDVQPVFARTFLPYRNLFEIRHLEYERCTFAKRIIVTGFTPSQLIHTWSDFQRDGFSC